jgi:integrase
MGRGPGVRAVSDGSIQIDFKYRGVRCRERLRLEPSRANLRYAKGLKARIEHEIATGEFDYSRHFPESERSKTFAPVADSTPLLEALEQYIEGRRGALEPETIDDYLKCARAFAKDFPNETLATLTKQRMREWLSGKQLTRKRLLNLLTPLRGAITQAVDDGILQKDPIQGFKIGRRAERPREIVDPLSPEELKAVARTGCGQLWVFWAWTGLRTSELIGLRWDDVAGDLGSLRVWRSIRLGREKRTKTSSGVRDVPVLEPARRILRDLDRRDGQLVFPHPVTGKGFHGDRQVRTIFHRDCQTAGVRKRPGPYTLRHTFASMALSAGEPIGWVSTVMGHNDPTITLKVYAKWIPSVMPDAGAKMLRQVEGS